MTMTPNLFMTDEEQDLINVSVEMKSQIKKILNTQVEEVGVYGKMGNDAKYFTIDYLVYDDLEYVRDKLREADIEFYCSMDCFSFELNGKRVRVYVTKNAAFAFNALYAPRFYQTKFHYDILPCLVGLVCKARFYIEYGHVTYYPTRGLYADRKLIFSDWEQFTKELGLGKLETVEDILENVRYKFSDLQQSVLSDLMIEDAYFNNILWANNACRSDYLKRFYGV